jgi:hypothetical protein
MSLLLRDPWFQAMVEEAMTRHRHALTRSEIAAFRRALAFTFETHPTARRILARARPDLESRLPPLDLELYPQHRSTGKDLS